MNNQNAIHVCVRDTARAVLEAHGFPRHEMQDALADVTVRMIEAAETSRRRDIPRSVLAWAKLAAQIAARYAREERGLTPLPGAVRTAPAGDRVFTEEEADTLAHLIDGPTTPGRSRSQTAVLLGMLDEGEMPALAREILTLIGSGKTVDATAGALGITPDDVRGRLRLTRACFFCRIAAVGDATEGLLDVAADSELEPQSH